MVSKERIIEGLDKTTDRLSTQVRTVAMDVLILDWGLLVGQSDIAKGFSGSLRKQLLVIGLAAILVLALDYLQQHR